MPYAKETLERLRSAGWQVFFATNNSTATRDEYVTRLKTLGLGGDLEHVVTSAYATAHYLERLQPKPKDVLVIGADGLPRRPPTPSSSASTSTSRMRSSRRRSARSSRARDSSAAIAIARIRWRGVCSRAPARSSRRSRSRRVSARCASGNRSRSCSRRPFAEPRSALDQEMQDSRSSSVTAPSTTWSLLTGSALSACSSSLVSLRSRRCMARRARRRRIVWCARSRSSSGCPISKTSNVAGTAVSLPTWRRR